MTTKLIVIFLLTGNFSIAQLKPQPTRFDKFVHKPTIEWAAYASDTFSFAGFNNLLLERLQKKQIKASLPLESRTGGVNHIKYSELDTINNAFYGDNVDYMMDSMGNEVSVKKPIPKKDTSNFKITEVTQILYIENGTLKSYIPFITPTLPVFISTGNYIGEQYYFTTGFNYKFNKKARKKNKLLFLSQTKKMITLNPERSTDKLKEMYGRNLLETVWAHIPEVGTALFSVDGYKLNYEEINISGPYIKPQPVPIYDSTSKSTIIKYIAVGSAFSGQYTHVQLLQDWYYDQKKNIVFSNIREMYVYLKEADKDIEPVFKLVFK